MTAHWFAFGMICRRPPPAREGGILSRSIRLLCRGPVPAVVAFAIIGSARAPATADPGEPVYATAAVAPNQPMGQAKGIFPGRVVWVHDARAVNQDCTVDAAGHGWFLAENNHQAIIDGMVSSALRNLTGQASDRAAWDAIFKFHNATRGKGAVNYARGEKIFIKINATSAYAGNFNPADLTPYAFISETSVGSVLAVLRQLVGVAGVDQVDIYVGDPLKHIYKHLYDVWHGEFPNVHYLDNSGYRALGREPVVPSATAVIHYSDRGAILRTNVWSDSSLGDNPVAQDNLYRVFEDAEYLINIPMLKGHKRAGVTMFAKNHFGSQTRGDASHLHNGLVAPTEMPNVSRGGYGLYRVQVDIMGHALLGRKNLLYLMDALWATDYELDVPLKWQMPPFANTFMASLFASLDPVAIESVGYDFLRSEFTAERVPVAGTYVQMPGVDDYLHQAADAANWPAGITYDPDNTGAAIPSLGTHEHWNDAGARQYSRNLSPTGAGIELFWADQVIRTEPLASPVAAPGGTATFAAAAIASTPLTYRWQRQAGGGANWTDLSDNATYSGASAAALTVSPVGATMDGDSFRCVVSNSGGTATTASAVLVVSTPSIVNLFAGSPGTSGGADGSGPAARFTKPADLAVDAAGSLYVADTNNHTIRRITAAGVVTTLAGQAGVSGSSDGTGTAARFNHPAGVAVDISGNVYVADTDNCVIRKVTAAGAVSTLAGLAGASGSADGSGSGARFSGPSGIVADTAGNVCVADTLNHTIRRITPAGVVTTLAGAAGASGAVDASGSAARFRGPQGLAMDTSGNLFVADSNNSVIRRIATTTGAVTTVAGQAGVVGGADGAVSQARFHFPSGIAVDAAGRLYVADTDNQTLRLITPTGTVSTLAGLAGTSGSADGTGSAARFAYPTGVAATGSGDVYVADTDNHAVRLAFTPVAPAITQQPRNQAAAAGANVTFSVGATGRPAPTYQWTFNGAAVSGATSSTLNLTSVQTANAGTYAVLVTNGASTVTSDQVTLTVTAAAGSGNGSAGGGGAFGAWFCAFAGLLLFARRILPGSGGPGCGPGLPGRREARPLGGISPPATFTQGRPVVAKEILFPDPRNS